MNLAELHYVGKMLMECATNGMQALGKESLTATELVVAETLYVLGPVSIGDIARRTGFVQSRISTVVADLHERGIVRVYTDGRDRRRTIVEISEASLAEVARVSAGDAFPALTTWFPNATSSQVDALVDALSGAIASFDPATTTGANGATGILSKRQVIVRTPAT
ncbi:MAG TPA: MarR family transcriptional regulator [Thermomicrobiales bacterium]|nr:MarR family transcriptional regulator [Thermomicrobiales bacterium]